MTKHLVFYDGECGFCDHVVQFLLRQDTHQIFMFAPLQGTTAGKLLKKLPSEMKNKDSLVLIEDFKGSDPRFYIQGKGVFRIFWLLGGLWAVPGLISWLPSFLYDWGYRLVANNRHRLFKNISCVIPTKETQGRFLP